MARAAGDALYTGHENRVRHAAGQSYPDVLRKRTGELDEAPNAVIVPAGAGAVTALIEACAQERVAIVPFGGGTSVVGGVAAARGGLDAVVSLDLSRLRHVEIDRRSLTARLGPGLRGPEAEAALAVEGLTLGHFPQSFVYATIGGFAATRSAGQASSGVGRSGAPAPESRDRAVARSQGRRFRGDRSPGRDHHPSPRRRSRPRSVYERGGWRGRLGRASGGKGTAGPDRNHEPRQAAVCLSVASPSLRGDPGLSPLASTASATMVSGAVIVGAPAAITTATLGAIVGSSGVGTRAPRIWLGGVRRDLVG